MRKAMDACASALMRACDVRKTLHIPDRGGRIKDHEESKNNELLNRAPIHYDTQMTGSARHPQMYGIMMRDAGYTLSTWFGAKEYWSNRPEFPRDLLHVLRYANANGQDWVLSDADADREPNLPWYVCHSGIDMNHLPVPIELNYPIPNMLSKVIGQFKFPNGLYGLAVTPAKVSPGQLVVTRDRILEDGDYKIRDGDGVWISVAGDALRIKDQDDHLANTGFVDGHELDEPFFEDILWHYDIDDTREEFETVGEAKKLEFIPESQEF